MSGHEQVVLVIRGVTDYSMRRRALRYDMEVLMPDGEIRVLKALPNTAVKLLPIEQ